MNEDVWKVVVGVFTIVVTSLFGGSALYRRFSRDKAVAASDSGEISLIERLQSDIKRREEERVTDYARWTAERKELIERADRINDERNEAIRKIGALEQEVHQLKKQVMDLSALVEKSQHAAADHAREAAGLRTQVSALMGLIERNNIPREEP